MTIPVKIFNTAKNAAPTRGGVLTCSQRISMSLTENPYILFSLIPFVILRSRNKTTIKDITSAIGPE